MLRFRDREAKAAKVAREIEGNTSTHLAAELENGDDDEENAFSAVQRDPSQRKEKLFYCWYPLRTEDYGLHCIFTFNIFQTTSYRR